MFNRAFKGLVIMAVAAVIGVPLAKADGAPTLPAPTGKYPVGRVTVYMLDTSRDDAYGTQKDHKREFMTIVWYPAKPGSKGTPAPWFPADWAHLPENAAIGKPLKLPAKETGDFMASVVSHSQEGIPLASSHKPFPVILLVPGSISFPTEYSTFAEDLASHGFVVVGDVSPSNVAAVSFPSGNINGFRSRHGEVFDNWVGESKDLIYEMDQLEVWNKTEGNQFFRRLDLNHIGAFGHSRGGLIASRLPHMDKRVKAVALLDPGIVRPEDGEAIPVLVFRSDHKPSPDDEKTKNETDYAQKAAPGIQLMLIGGDHVNFGDLPLFMNFAKASVNSKALNDTVRAVLRAFFGQYLKGKRSDLLVKPSRKYPLLKIEKNPLY